MGEAKDQSKLGPTRRIHLRAMEKADLVGYFTAEHRGGKPGWTAASRSQRKQLRSALEQLGALELWRVGSGRGRAGGRVEIPPVEVREISVDAISFLLENLQVATGTESLALADLEDRLEDAKRGLYEVPADVVQEMEEFAAARALDGAPGAAHNGAAAPAERGDLPAGG